MKVGDLTRLTEGSKTVGIIVDFVQKKVWRANVMGKKVDWSIIDPEPHAVVLFAHNNGTINIPTVELEVVDENNT